MKDLHTIAQERSVVEGEIKSLRVQIANGEEALADKRKRLDAALEALQQLRVQALRVFDKTEMAGLPLAADAATSACEHRAVSAGVDGMIYRDDCGEPYRNKPSYPFADFGHPAQYTNGADPAEGAAKA